MKARTRLGVRAVTVVLLGLVGAGAAYVVRVAGLGTPAAEGERPAADHQHADASESVIYTCPMHPSVRQRTPGRCPLCGMDLTPVAGDEGEAGVVVIDEARRQRSGIRTTRVGREPLVLEIQALGRVVVDETRLHDVVLRQSGWITRVHANQSGQRVAKGQVLLEVYSPELYAAQLDYLVALRSRDAGRGAGMPDRSDTLVELARKRLLLWNVPEALLEGLARRREAMTDVPVLSPVSGYLVEQLAVAGAAVEPGQRLSRIAALDTVWVEADLYEADLPHVREGQRVRITLAYLPGRTVDGSVALVQPLVDQGSRTGRARIVLDNRDLALRPGMYATVTLLAPLGERLTVPVSAVLYTGPRRLVFVDLGEGRLQPRDVVLGARAGERYEVVDGLREGDVVVSSGNFLVSAESRIRSATGLWGGEHGSH